MWPLLFIGCTVMFVSRISSYAGWRDIWQFRPHPVFGAPDGHVKELDVVGTNSHLISIVSQVQFLIEDIYKLASSQVRVRKILMIAVLLLPVFLVLSAASSQLMSSAWLLLTSSTSLPFSSSSSLLLLDKSSLALSSRDFLALLHLLFVEVA